MVAAADDDAVELQGAVQVEQSVAQLARREAVERVVEQHHVKEAGRVEDALGPEVDESAQAAGGLPVTGFALEVFEQHRKRKVAVVELLEAAAVSIRAGGFGGVFGDDADIPGAELGEVFAERDGEAEDVMRSGVAGDGDAQLMLAAGHDGRKNDAAEELEGQKTAVDGEFLGAGLPCARCSASALLRTGLRKEASDIDDVGARGGNNAGSDGVGRVRKDGGCAHGLAPFACMPQASEMWGSSAAGRETIAVPLYDSVLPGRRRAAVPDTLVDLA